MLTVCLRSVADRRRTGEEPDLRIFERSLAL